MRILVLGHGKTGRLVADVAHERGHGVHVLDAKENPSASALTAPFLTGFDVVLDFTPPEAVLPNLRALLANAAKVVVGTTGWYMNLKDMRDLAERRNAGLLYGTNFSVGVQSMLKLAKQMADLLGPPGYTFTIDETHHSTKLDAPSGTALSLRQTIATLGHIEITSNREGDATGTHTLEARSDADRLILTHESFSRRGFAEGAVRAAEWLSTRTGVYEFSEIYDKL